MVLVFTFSGCAGAIGPQGEKGAKGDIGAAGAVGATGAAGPTGATGATGATGPTGLTPQSPVSLGSAANFAVLAYSTVTNTGNTTVTGNLGLSPGTAVTGFPPGILNGTQYTGTNATAVQAQIDLTTAYNDIANRIGGLTIPGGPGQLAGRTLTAGLYTSASSLDLAVNGVLTLSGTATDVFIFQMGSTLTIGDNSSVLLTGGVLAKNIFWQVGSSATLGTNSVFKGNILALASISLNTGATLNGRALAQTGAVTLIANTIVKPQ